VTAPGARIPEGPVKAVLVFAAVGIVFCLLTFGFRAGLRRLALSLLVAGAGTAVFVRYEYLGHRAQLVKLVGAAAVKPVLWQAWGGVTLVATFAVFALSTWWVVKHPGGWRRRRPRASGGGQVFPVAPPGGGRWEL
jgi:hypothetical protein